MKIGVAASVWMPFDMATGLVGVGSPGEEKTVTMADSTRVLEGGEAMTAALSEGELDDSGALSTAVGSGARSPSQETLLVDAMSDMVVVWR